jgi:hypothetical protein
MRASRLDPGLAADTDLTVTLADPGTSCHRPKGTRSGRVAFATVRAVTVAECQAALDAAQATLIIRPPRLANSLATPGPHQNHHYGISLVRAVTLRLPASDSGFAEWPRRFAATRALAAPKPAAVNCGNTVPGGIPHRDRMKCHFQHGVRSLFPRRPRRSLS